jgi:aminoglycoside 3-N-acetyltransferase
MVAVGGRAQQLTDAHPLDYGYGRGSPLAKLIDLGGHVLMLGAPLDTITLLHHAENRARMRRKNIIHYTCPILRDGEKVWVSIEDFDTGDPHADYSFEQIARAFLTVHPVPQASIGQADSYLFDAAALNAFAVAWLEARFG